MIPRSDKWLKIPHKGSLEDAKSSPALWTQGPWFTISSTKIIQILILLKDCWTHICICWNTLIHLLQMPHSATASNSEGSKHECLEKHIGKAKSPLNRKVDNKLVESNRMKKIFTPCIEPISAQHHYGYARGKLTTSYRMTACHSTSSKHIVFTWINFSDCLTKILSDSSAPSFSEAQLRIASSCMISLSYRRCKIWRKYYGWIRKFSHAHPITEPEMAHIKDEDSSQDHTKLVEKQKYIIWWQVTCENIEEYSLVDSKHISSNFNITSICYISKTILLLMANNGSKC